MNGRVILQVTDLQQAMERCVLAESIAIDLHHDMGNYNSAMVWIAVMLTVSPQWEIFECCFILSFRTTMRNAFSY